MKRTLRRLLVALPIALLAVPSAVAEQVPDGAEGHHPHFEVRAGGTHIAMVPIGEGDRTGQHIRVALSSGTMQNVKYHGACGRVVLHGPVAERIPAFAPQPALHGAAIGTSRVCGEASCACPTGGADMVHINKPPTHLADEANDVVGRFVPVLPDGDTPRLVGADPEPGCFGWLEITVNTTGLAVGTQIVASIDSYRAGAPLTGPPTHKDAAVAAVVTP